MIGLLLALYPAQWRRRYGEEFRAVLESRPLGPFDVADVLLGALDARSRGVRIAGSAQANGGRFTMLRIGGFAALIGGPMWVVAFILGSATRSEEPVWLLLLATGNVAMLVALAGLSAFQAHRNVMLTWAAFLIPAIGMLLSVAGIYGTLTLEEDAPLLLGWNSWSIWMIGTLSVVIGSVLFAIATIRAEVMSRRAAVSLAGSSVLFFVAGLLGVDGGTNIGTVIAASSIAWVGGSWAWLGASAHRRGPIRAVVSA
jgi:hypothetical protein